MANKKYQPRDKLTEKKAQVLFANLCTEYEIQYGEPDQSALHMISDIAMLEQVKEGCRKYIGEKGVMVDWQNGANQGGERENPLLAKLNQTTEQQRKMLGELKLTPASKKAVEKPTGADSFEDF